MNFLKKAVMATVLTANMSPNAQPAEPIPSSPVHVAVDAAKARLEAAFKKSYGSQCRDLHTEYKPEYPDLELTATCNGDPLKLRFDAPYRPQLDAEGVFRYTKEFQVNILMQFPTGAETHHWDNYMDATSHWLRMQKDPSDLDIINTNDNLYWGGAR